MPTTLRFGAPRATSPFAAIRRSWPETASLEQAGAGRVGDGGGARRQPQLGPHVRHVAVHGVLAEHEPLGDLGVAEPLGDEPQDLQLARRELAQRAPLGRRDARRLAGAERGERRPAGLLLGGRRLVAAERGERAGELEPGERGLVGGAPTRPAGRRRPRTRGGRSRGRRAPRPAGRPRSRARPRTYGVPSSAAACSSSAYASAAASSSPSAARARTSSSSAGSRSSSDAAGARRSARSAASAAPAGSPASSASSPSPTSARRWEPACVNSSRASSSPALAGAQLAEPREPAGGHRRGASAEVADRPGQLELGRRPVAVRGQHVAVGAAADPHQLAAAPVAPRTLRTASHHCAARGKSPTPSQAEIR